MAYLSSTNCAFILLIFQTTICKFAVYSNSLTARTKFQIPHIFGQNLTGVINKVLKDDSLHYKAVIKESLQRSPIVYYESDLLLEEIENIIPVIDLLDELTPDASHPPKVTLSLPYNNETDGTFLWRRIGDIYYSLEGNFSAENRTKILKTLASITLNFVSLRWQESSQFNYGSNLNDFQFVNYVKNFISLYFGNHAIPVGFMWNFNMKNNYLVNREIPHADFLIFYTEFDPRYEYPLFLEQFDIIMSNIIYNVPPNATIFMNAKAIPTQIENTAWNRDYFSRIGNALKATSKYQNASAKFVRKLYETSENLINYIFLSWASMKNRNIIIGNSLQNLSSTIITENGTRCKLIVPYIKVEEVKITACDLKVQFTKWNNNYEAVLLDERSWRTLARFKVDLEDSQQTCNGTALLQDERGTLKIAIQFTNGLASQWNNVEERMKRLIYSYPKISKMVLDTIIFYEQDLKDSLKIQQFITAAKSKYKIGCSMKYESITSVLNNFTYYHNTFLEDTFKNEMEGFLCQPIFQKLDVMVWYAPQSEYLNNINYLPRQLLNLCSNMFLTREIFQNTFPNIKVYIQFSSIFDKRILANVFDVPIIVSSDQILY